MRYGMFYNQSKQLEWGLKPNEVLLFTIFLDLPKWATIQKVGKTSYYRISRSKIMEELEGLKLSNPTITRMINRLVEVGVIERKMIVLDNGKAGVYRVSKKGKTYTEIPDKGACSKMNMGMFKNEQGHVQKRTRACSKMSNYTNTNTNTNNTITINTNSNRAKLEISPPPIEERIEKFRTELIPFVEQYGKETIRAFFDYWSESSDKGKKFRKEKEKTWQLSKRLARWKAKEEEFKPRSKQKQQNSELHFKNQNVKPEW